MVHPTAGPEDTPEKLEEGQQAVQEFIDTGTYPCMTFPSGVDVDKMSTAEPHTEEETLRKEAYIKDSFPDWSRCDFQQFVKALEAYGW